MMFERFTPAARAAVARAELGARELGGSAVGTEHLLLGLADPAAGGAGMALAGAGLTAPRVRRDIERLAGQACLPLDEQDAEALRAIGIDLDEVRSRLLRTFGPQGLQDMEDLPGRRRRGGRADCRTRLTPRAKKVLELSLREAIAGRHGSIGPEHILLGLLRDGNGQGARIISAAGADAASLRRVVLDSLRSAA